MAETLRLYGSRFLPAVGLGVPLAGLDQLALGHGRATTATILVAAAPVLSAVYAVAASLVLACRPAARAWSVALVAGTLVWIPAGFVFPWFAIASVAWLALAGLAVPAAVDGGGSVRAALRRGVSLGRADYVHAAGSLATLVILFGVTRIALGVLLRSQADAAVRATVFLADTVLGPILFLGAAVLYVDQAARAVGSPRRRRRRSDAHVPDADDAHGEGRPDAQVEPRTAP